MKIINQPKIMLTTEEADAFNCTIKVLEAISVNLKDYDEDLSTMAGDAWNMLTDIWADEAINVE